MLSKQVSRKTPTQLRYKQRSVFMKDVIDQILYFFELGYEQGIVVPIFEICGLQH